MPIVVRLERGLRLNAKEYWYFIRLPFMNKVYDIEWENQTKNTLVEGRCSPTSFPGSLFSASFVLNDKGGREERPWDQGWMFTLFANSASQKGQNALQSQCNQRSTSFNARCVIKLAI